MAALILSLVACDGGKGIDIPPQPGPATTNVLVLLTDDQGVDKVAAYGEHPTPPRTPRIDALAADGVLFRNAYAAPICTPTRAALLTGRYGRRTGYGGTAQFEMGKELPLDEVTLPERLRAADPPYANAAFGKWHLGAFNAQSGTDHPNLSGFDHFAGSMGNLYDARQDDGGAYGYYRWERVEDGAVALETRYATTATVDDALDAIATLPEPWLVYVAFNAPHRPLDAPPPGLGAYGDLSGERDDHVLYDAVVEALDTEIGRLLDTVDPDVLQRTTVFFLGDNGTERRAIREPWDPRRGKDTPFEGGSHVPFLVTGPLVVEPGTSDAFVHVVDVFATVEALAGLAPDGVERDGLSLLPLLADPAAAWPRDVVHYEKFEPAGPPPYDVDWRISRDARWKWMQIGEEAVLYDVGDRPDDGDTIDPAALSAEDRAAVDSLFAEHAAFWQGLPPPVAP